jgi:hypothetical protein
MLHTPDPIQRQMKRPLMDRIQDRVWREVGQRLALETDVSLMAREGGDDASISGNMPWTKVCSALADGTLDSRDFRRLKAVRQVVETVGPSDARFYAQRIREWGGGWLEDPRVVAFDDWGNPIRCPRLLLGTPKPFSPTTLRYLATALWLQRSHKLPTGSVVLEIGVGFGGLAAMNHLVSESLSVLVDLPQVEQAARRMLEEIGMSGHAEKAKDDSETSIPLVISNYAFTELSTALQDAYLEKYLKQAAHGMIMSNAGVFASSIGGRTDGELVDWLRDSGIAASLESDHELLSPTDMLGGVRLIHW